MSKQSGKNLHDVNESNKKGENRISKINSQLLNTREEVKYAKEKKATGLRR